MAKTSVYVKPIVKEKWHGLHKVGRAKFQDTQDTIQVLFDSKEGGLATGLTKEDEQRLGAALGVDLSNKMNNEYWQDFNIKLKDQTMVFDLSNPMHELQLKVLQASKFVANSQRELDNGKFPFAKYIIYDEQQELEKEATEVANKAKAVDIFNKLSSEKKLDVLKVYGKALQNSSQDFVYTKLFEIVEDDPTGFKRTASMPIEEIKTRALIFDLERKGIFRKKGTAYLYNDQQVGFDYQDTVQYLLNPKNQELLVKLKTDLEIRDPRISNYSTTEVSEKKIVKKVKKVTSKKTASKKSTK